jgi:pectin methylesterase-like acyl-CoA thioesterase
VLLSNAVDAKVENAWVRASGDSIALQSSVLGPTTNVELRDIHLFGGNGIVKGAGDRGDLRNISVERASNEEGANLAFAKAPNLAYALDLATIEKPGTRRSLVVAPGETIQSAVDALPAAGGEITIKPGTYREVVTIRKPKVRLRGGDSDPSKTTIVFHNGPANGGTFASATVYVEAPDVTLDHLTIANDLGNGKGQAVALAVTADRAVFRNLRILGAQDTLFAASRLCYGDYGPCAPARQYFADSYVEGNTDFIFGDALAVFERCELHGVAPGTVMYTAQSRHTAEQTQSAYVFDHCRLTAAPREQGSVSLGRPWRPYATVVFLHARIEAPVIPAGWTEWARFGKPSLPTAYYAEYDSTGPGANPRSREPYSHPLTAAEARRWAPRLLLAGDDGWDPLQ